MFEFLDAIIEDREKLSDDENGKHYFEYMASFVNDRLGTNYDYYSMMTKVKNNSNNLNYDYFETLGMFARSVDFSYTKMYSVMDSLASSYGDLITMKDIQKYFIAQAKPLPILDQVEDVVTTVSSDTVDIVKRTYNAGTGIIKNGLDSSEGFLSSLFNGVKNVFGNLSTIIMLVLTVVILFFGYRLYKSFNEK